MVVPYFLEAIGPTNGNVRLYQPLAHERSCGLPQAPALLTAFRGAMKSASFMLQLLCQSGGSSSKASLRSGSG